MVHSAKMGTLTSRWADRFPATAKSECIIPHSSSFSLFHIRLWGFVSNTLSFAQDPVKPVVSNALPIPFLPPAVDHSVRERSMDNT